MPPAPTPPPSPPEAAIPPRANEENLRLRAENAALQTRVAKLEAESTHGTAARRAALNLMEDAVESRRRAEALNAELRREVGERKRVEHALREVDQRKDEFLAMLGHELRTPLAAIKGGLMLLSAQNARPESREAALPIVAEQVAHMEHLIDDLLDIARIERGKLQLHPEPLSIQDAIEAALAMVREPLHAKSATIHRDLPVVPVVVHADRVRLTQILVNLLANALKFSSDGATVDVSVRTAQGEAIISLRDYGAGIAPELLPHIFDAFVQSQRSLSLPEAGLGLGLAVSRHLVELHGGSIEAFSAGEHHGSEFVVRLPLPHPAAP